MNNQTKFFFLAGSPGSAWSMIGQQIKNCLPYKFDLSDETKSRGYCVPSYHKKNYISNKNDFEIITHRGVYFGPYHEYGHMFDDLTRYSRVDDFYTECLAPFTDNSLHCKLIKSHWFSYNLDWIWNNCKGHYLALVWRDPDAAEDWWYKMGGWNIDYPIYTWYQSPEKMKKHIQQENQLIWEFANKKGLEWVDHDHQGQWLKKLGGTEFVSHVHPNFGDVPKIMLAEIT